MTYNEFKSVYKWTVRTYPDTTSIYKENMTEKFCTVKIINQVKAGSRWKTTEESIEEASRENYFNIVDAIPFFRNIGGRETVTKSYTKHGYIPVAIKSTSPGKTERTIREFSF